MELITGVVEDIQSPVLFSVPNNEFRFCFMTDAIQSAGITIKPISLNGDDGFIYGRTHDNHRIAIYSGDREIRVYGKQMLNTSAYIVSSGNVNPDDINKFNGISFSGGTLNRVFRINGIEFDYSLEGGSIGKINDDSRVFDIEIAGKEIHVDLRSGISFNEGQDGKVIRNSGATLTLTFDQEVPLSEIFTHYDAIRRVLSFMTYRKHVGFDSVSILRKTDEYDFPVESGKVYINEENSVELKDYQRNISIEDLGDAFPALVSLFYETGSDSIAPIISFLPENEKEVFYMTGDKLKAICSSLENELEYVDDIQVEENAHIEELKVLVKDYIKTYKKEHQDFPEGAYSLINNSIANWSLSLRERVCALCQNYSAEISALNQTDEIIDDEAIKDFVKYRNSITHGNAKPMTMRVAETAFILSGVIYCCVLNRIGVTKEKILELASYKLIR